MCVIIMYVALCVFVRGFVRICTWFCAYLYVVLCVFVRGFVRVYVCAFTSSSEYQLYKVVIYFGV